MNQFFKEEDILVTCLPDKNRSGMASRNSNGISIKHIPTGIYIEVDCCRSQYRNREIALNMLLCALTDPLFQPI